MKLSPLQLKHYFLTELSLAVNPKAIPDNIQFDGDSIYPKFDEAMFDNKTVLATTPDSKDQRKFILHLTLTCEPKKEGNFPYSFKSHVIGIFEIAHDGALEERKRLVVVNGTSILYGIMREKFLSLSSRFPFGPIMLPSADFRSLQQAEEKPKVRRKKQTTPPKGSPSLD